MFTYLLTYLKKGGEKNKDGRVEVKERERGGGWGWEGGGRGRERGRKLENFNTQG